jgi:GDSL-like Lipase/Acylhydrolase family
MPHLVLMGDSIFDNGFYVPGKPAVIEQVRAALPGEWQATLLAVDGNVTIDVIRHLERLPPDTTHLAISAGGNDALGCIGILSQPAESVAQVLEELAEIQDSFQQQYHDMLGAALSRQLPTVVCTIYDAVPGLTRDARAALSFFNEAIIREAAAARIPVLDLRSLCRLPSDFSPISPIEPSVIGGEKIATALAKFIATRVFTRECVIFT